MIVRSLPVFDGSGHCRSEKAKRQGAASTEHANLVLQNSTPKANHLAKATVGQLWGAERSALRRNFVRTDVAPTSSSLRRYRLLIETLVDLRRGSEVSQVELSKRLGKDQPFISNIERGIRRIDLIEFYAITRALGGDPEAVFSELVRRLPKDVAI